MKHCIAGGATQTSTDSAMQFFCFCLFQNSLLACYNINCVLHKLRCLNALSVKRKDSTLCSIERYRTNARGVCESLCSLYRREVRAIISAVGS